MQYERTLSKNKKKNTKKQLIDINLSFELRKAMCLTSQHNK